MAHKSIAFEIRRMTDDMIVLVEERKESVRLLPALCVLLSALDFQFGLGDWPALDTFRKMRDMGPFGSYDSLRFFEELDAETRTKCLAVLRLLVDALEGKADESIDGAAELALALIPVFDKIERRALTRARRPLLHAAA